jgi:hypothetical protein
MADEPKIGEERRHHDEPDMTTAPDAICSIAAVEHLVEPAPTGCFARRLGHP